MQDEQEKKWQSEKFNSSDTVDFLWGSQGDMCFCVCVIVCVSLCARERGLNIHSSCKILCV